MNKIALKKETSAIFLAIVLVLGTIALTVPSFSVEAQATSDREKDHDYEDRDYKSRDHDKKDYYNDDEDKNSYEKAESEYSSYGKYDRDHDKSEKDNSNSVSIKKVKCNNINVNINGLNANIGLPNNGPVTDPVAVAQQDDDDNDEEIETNSIESDNERYESRDGKSDSNTNSSIVCINNNNNIVVEEEEPPVDECAEEVENCFEEFLNDEQFELLTDALESSEGITADIAGQEVTLRSFEDMCEAFEGLSFEQLLDAISDILDETLPPGDIVSFDLFVCIAEALDIPVPPV